MNEQLASTTLPDRPAGLLAALGAALAGPGQVRSRATDRLALGHDASHFVLTPSVGGHAADAAEVGRLFAVSAAQGVPLTFRSGGTSLCGQAVTDGILVDTRRHFRDIEVLDGGARVRVGPGATVRQVNARLARLRAQARPRPGQRDRLHARRCRRQQLQRHGLRHGREHLPHAGFAGRWCCPAAPSSTPAPPTPTSGCGRWNPSCTQGLAAAARPGARQPGVGADHRAAVLDEEHHGLRAQLAARPRPARSTSSPTWWSAARARWPSSRPR